VTTPQPAKLERNRSVAWACVSANAHAIHVLATLPSVRDLIHNNLADTKKATSSNLCQTDTRLRRFEIARAAAERFQGQL
jgi:hypothetical protein